MAKGVPSPRTLREALEQSAERFSGRGVGLVDRRGRVSERWRYPELLELARRGAGRLAALGVAPGERVVVCLPTGESFFESWLGAVLLGAWPVAMAPTGPKGFSQAHLAKVAGTVEKLGARHLLAGAALRQEAERQGAAALAAAVVAEEELAAVAPAASFPQSEADPQGVAFLQLTSGSTGLPRAVMITHAAALHNVRAIDEASGAPYGAPAREWIDCWVSWLPLHHDMGLVGCLLNAIDSGFDLWLLQPRSFVARPWLWLEHLGAHGTAFSTAPNFGYQLCSERTPGGQRDGLDLAPWKAAMVGAEMVRPETLADFCSTFAAHGFDPAAVRPCYGLAEATLAVTLDRRGEGLRTRPAPAGSDSGLGLAEVASLGPPLADTELRIVRPDGRPLADGQVGEVWVKGPGVFAGYYQDSEATAEALHDGWLATGDLGFTAGGELYLTGRIKELLIVRGQNLMPHELEWLAEEVTGGGGALRSAAFSVARGAQGEEAVLVLESESREPEALAHLEREVRLKVAHALQLPLADVLFLRRGQIPKTTSGKVQRRELRRRYLDGELERLPLAPPVDD